MEFLARIIGVGSRRPLLLSLRSSKAFIVFVVSYAIFVDQFVFAVIVPVMPFSLHQQIGISEDSVQYWVSILLSIYGVASFVASPVWGWYTDRSAVRKIPFLISLLVTLGSTAMIWKASSIGLQIVARLLQGSAAAFVWITGLAMIADAMEQADVGQSLGYPGIAMMLGTLVAPLLGGVVFARAGYDAVFEMTLGLIAVDVLLRLFTIERKVGQQWDENFTSENASQSDQGSEKGLPKQSAEKQTPIGQDQDLARSQPTVLEDSPVSRRRRRSQFPAILTLLLSRRLVAALWGTLVTGAIYSGLETVLPLQTQAVFGWDSIGGGLIFLPLTLTAFLGPVIGKICDRYGPRWPVLTGFMLLCPSLTLLRLVDHDSLRQKILLCALLTLIGCCFTMTVDPLMAEVAYVAEQKAKDDPETYGSANKAYAQAFALWSMAFSAGNTVGPLIAGLIRDEAGWGTMSWVLGLLAALTAVTAGLWCGGWIFKRDQRWNTPILPEVENAVSVPVDVKQSSP